MNRIEELTEQIKMKIIRYTVLIDQVKLLKL